LGYDRMSIWFREYESYCAKGTFGTDEFGQTTDERQMRLKFDPDELLGEVFSGARPIVFNPDHEICDENGRVLGMGSCVLVAMYYGDKIVGCMTADNVINRIDFTDFDLEYLAMYASTVGHLCMRKQVEDELRGDAVRLAELQEVGNALSRADTIDVLCREAVRLGRSRLGFDRLAVFFRDEEQDFLVGSYGTDEAGNPTDERHLRVKIDWDSDFGLLFSGKRRLVVGRYLSGRPPPPGFQNAAAPLVHGDQIMGCLVSDNLLRLKRFSDFDLQLLSMFASTLGHLCARKRAEADLVDTLIVAKRANASKDEFFAMMSHELRTPLNAIMGFSKLLRDCPQDEEERELVDGIVEASGRQLSLIDGILHFARLDRGVVEKQAAPINPVLLCQSALEDARASKPELEFSLVNGTGEHPALPEGIEVSMDGAMVRQVLDNLLSNACKYTPEGAVTVEIGMAGFGRGQISLHVAVADTGIGMSPETQKIVFEPFAQANSSHSRKFQGAGLGLAICQKLVRVLDGEIAVESEEGKGSRFWFHVPVQLCETVRGAAARRESPLAGMKLDRACRALVVDDIVANVKLVSMLLTRFGATVKEARGGEEAVEACQQERFDLILMDLAMPGMDGFEAVRAIRAQPGANQDTPIVALTADVTRGIQARCEKAGMNGYVAKPVTFASLFDAVRDAVTPIG